MDTPLQTQTLYMSSNIHTITRHKHKFAQMIVVVDFIFATGVTKTTLRDQSDQL